MLSNQIPASNEAATTFDVQEFLKSKEFEKNVNTITEQVRTTYIDSDVKRISLDAMQKKCMAAVLANVKDSSATSVDELMAEVSAVVIVTVDDYKHWIPEWFDDNQFADHLMKECRNYLWYSGNYRNVDIENATQDEYIKIWEALPAIFKNNKDEMKDFDDLKRYLYQTIRKDLSAAIGNRGAGSISSSQRKARAVLSKIHKALEADPDVECADNAYREIGNKDGLKAVLDKYGIDIYYDCSLGTLYDFYLMQFGADISLDSYVDFSEQNTDDSVSLACAQLTDESNKINTVNKDFGVNMDESAAIPLEDKVSLILASIKNKKPECIADELDADMVDYIEKYLKLSVGRRMKEEAKIKKLADTRQHISDKYGISDETFERHYNEIMKTLREELVGYLN